MKKCNLFYLYSIIFWFKYLHSAFTRKKGRGTNRGYRSRLPGFLRYLKGVVIQIYSNGYLHPHLVHRELVYKMLKLHNLLSCLQITTVLRSLVSIISCTAHITTVDMIRTNCLLWHMLFLKWINDT